MVNFKCYCRTHWVLAFCGFLLPLFPSSSPLYFSFPSKLILLPLLLPLYRFLPLPSRCNNHLCMEHFPPTFYSEIVLGNLCPKKFPLCLVTYSPKSMITLIIPVTLVHEMVRHANCIWSSCYWSSSNHASSSSHTFKWF